MRTPIFCQQLLLFFFALCLGTSSYTRAQQILLPATLLELQHSPSPYECGVLSAHVYQEGIKKEAEVSYEDRKLKHMLRDWKVLKIFQPKELSQAWQQLGLPYHCQAILYCNEPKKQLVLAHRGTQLKNFSSIKTDARSIAQNIIGGQEGILPVLLEE
ncbi:MAG: hypothetical protein AAFY41_13100, partial [Bacteroidota bacterium]